MSGNPRPFIIIIIMIIFTNYFPKRNLDHHVHYYDLRNPHEPVIVFKGHKKAVSYVKWLNGGEFVSA